MAGRPLATMWDAGESNQCVIMLPVALSWTVFVATVNNKQETINKYYAFYHYDMVGLLGGCFACSQISTLKFMGRKSYLFSPLHRRLHFISIGNVYFSNSFTPPFTPGSPAGWIPGLPTLDSTHRKYHRSSESYFHGDKF